MELTMSQLSKTWILDLDGTILKHNGYKIDGKDTLLKDAKLFLSEIKDEDMIIIVTSRKKEYKQETESFLKDNGIRYDHIIFEAPYGERIIVNDNKDSGLQMAYAICGKRNEVPKVRICRDENL